MICCVHACTGTNTANLSKPTACMNRSIASTLPRTWQDINNSLDPTAASNWQLSSIKRYNSESRPSHPPLPSQTSSFHWMKVMTKLHCSMNYNLWNISKGESFSSCTRHEATGDISLRLCMPQNKSCHVVKQGYSTGSLASLSMICLASKILCQLGCHLLLLCGSVVNLLLCTACERRWQGHSIICLAAW